MRIWHKAAVGLTGGLAALALAAPQAGRAQVAVARPVDGSLTQRQQQDLGGPRGPAPGFYRLRNLHSGLCLVVRPRTKAVPGVGIPGLPDNLAHMAQEPCDQGPALARLSEFAVLPHLVGGYTIRTTVEIGSDRPAAPGQITACATVARGVILGPPRIDFHPCDIDEGRSDWSFAGVADQRFSLVPRSAGNFTVAIGGGDCWALRNASREPLTDVIRWSCTGGADQVYGLELVRALPAGTEAGLFRADTWYPTASGYRWIRGAGGVSFQGAPYSQFDTANDNGAYCAKRCAELDQCKAWTWMGAAYVIGSNDPPRCAWYDQVPPAINRGEGERTRVRSGVVR
ncbi:MAG: PAN domain-containing protein [Novosphingobium sp.]|jgi:hypothetical protein|nr:hypothetical protein [Novosphingobium sp.]